MIGPVFVDTNVFVYLHDDSEPEKKLRAHDWIAFLVGHRSGRLSFQVLQEFYTILTRKLKRGFEEGEPQKIVRELASWQPIPIDFAVLEHAWLLEERYSLSWWDALIVAAAQICECEVLLTEDLQHGQTVSAVRVVDPFKSLDRTPAEVLEVLGK